MRNAHPLRGTQGGGPLKMICDATPPTRPPEPAHQVIVEHLDGETNNLHESDDESESGED